MLRNTLLATCVIFVARFCTATGCSLGYTLNGTICYKYFTQCLSWSGARSMCQKHNGSLYKISDDNSFRLAQALNNEIYAARGGDICTGGSWLGATLVNGVYRWEDGTLAEGSDYDSYYSIGNPDRLGSEACIEIRYWFKNLLNDHYCSSKKPFICQSDLTPCSSSPCLNGATCNFTGSNYNCSCITGYYGPQCEYTPCSVSPCQNNGTCSVSGSTYNCSCMIGHYGTQCEYYNECLADPCSIAGTLECEDLEDGYLCVCKPGYMGSNCEIEIDECDASPCSMTGTAGCVDLVNSFSCTCMAGYNGSLCEIDIDECEQEPCKNNGTCIDQENGILCNCQSGYDGAFCGEISTDDGGPFDDISIIYIGAGCGGALFIAIIIICCCIVRCRRAKSKKGKKETRCDDVERSKPQIAIVVNQCYENNAGENKTFDNLMGAEYKAPPDYDSVCKPADK